MAKPTLRFTATPDVGATVRLDLHQEGCWTDPREWEWGMPTLLGDPDGVGAAYGLRALKFVWYIEGSKSQATARLSDLARELLRDGNYLQFQIDTFGAPAWFQLVRTEPGAPSLRWVKSDTDLDVWAVDISLQAEPFILGAQESFTLTVPTDPTTTNAMTAVLPTIKGDAPAPLVMDLPGPSSSLTLISPWWSLIAIEDAWPGAQWFPVNTSTSATWTTGADTTLGASSATVSFSSTAGMAVRLTGRVVPAFAGRYRAMVRVTTPSGTTVKARIGSTTSATLAADGDRFVDLGVVSFPAFNPPAEKPYTMSAATIGAGGTVQIQLQRISGTGSATIGAVLLVPVDLPLDALAAPTTGHIDAQLGSSSVWQVNGEAERLVGFSSTSGALLSYTPDSTVVGGFPAVVPGGTNVLHLLTRKANGFSDEIETAVLSVPCTYRPRWLFLAAS